VTSAWLPISQLFCGVVFNRAKAPRGGLFGVGCP
jgi:hypothetical protein